MPLTIGSLFSGMGGLDLAVHEVFAAETAWFFEHEPPTDKNPRPRNAAARVLAHRFPDVPNHGDVTSAVWADVEPVGILAGGYPCVSQSQAGLRLGQDDDRWLWPAYRAAIRVLRPRLAVGENVEGHVQMDLRQVVADLQRDGYAVVWVTLAASDVGACHRRRRVFWLAWPEELGPPVLPRWPFAHLGETGWGVDDLLGWSDVGQWAYQGAAYQGAAYQGAAPTFPLLKTPTAQLAVNGGSQPPEKRREGGHGPTLADQIEHLLPTSRTTDTNGVGVHGDGGLDLRTVITLLPTPDCTHGRKTTRTSLLLPGVVEALLPTPNATDGQGGVRDVPGCRTHSGRDHGPRLRDLAVLLPTPKASDAAKGGPNQRGSSGDLALPAAVQHEAWAQYAAAIARHEAILGRPAPSPTGPHGRKGEQRLDGRFTEWMMMLPDGWVTGVPGISNKDAIKLCGNGVVPAQAAAALRRLLALAPASLLSVAVPPAPAD